MIPKCAGGVHSHPAYKALMVGPPDTASHSPLLPPGPQGSSFPQAVICPTLRPAQAFHRQFCYLLLHHTMHPSASRKLPPAPQWRILIRRPLTLFLALRLASKSACRVL